MYTYDQVLKLVAKEIQVIRKDATMTGPAIVIEVASRLQLSPWEGYNENLPYLRNIRQLCDRILRGDGLAYLHQRKEENSRSLSDDDPYGFYIDWGNPDESGRFINRMLLGASKHEKLRRQLCAA